MRFLFKLASKYSLMVWILYFFWFRRILHAMLYVNYILDVEIISSQNFAIAIFAGIVIQIITIQSTFSINETKYKN